MTYSDGVHGTYTLLDTYEQVGSKDLVESDNFGKYFFDSENNKLIVNLTETNYNTISSMSDFVMNGAAAASDTISAEIGWNICNSIFAAAVTAQTVTMEN